MSNIGNMMGAAQGARQTRSSKARYAIVRGARMRDARAKTKTKTTTTRIERLTARE